MLYPTYKNVGFMLVIADGASYAIFYLQIFILCFVFYDILTFIRTHILGLTFVTLIDFHLFFHKACGFMILFYSILHAMGHLFWTFPWMAQMDDLETLNYTINKRNFTELPTYTHLLFHTRPGVTGLCMLVFILLICVCSL